MSKSNNKYDEKSIKDLSKHPRKMLENSLGTYTDPNSPIGMTMEAIFNSTDELQNNKINKDKKIIIEWDEREDKKKGNIVTVKDNGRGIPLGKLETVTSKMNTTGKSKMGREDGTSGYKESVGVNGIGMKLVTYLSHFAKYTIQRDQKKVELLYKDGKKEYMKKLKYNKEEGSFTKIEFSPDNSFFHKALTFKEVHNVIKNIYFMYDDLKFIVKNKISNENYEYKNTKGLDHYYDREEFKSAKFLLENPIKLKVDGVKAKYKGQQYVADFNLTLNYYDQPEKSFKSGYNGWLLQQEGEIIKGFKRAYKAALIKAADDLNEKIPNDLNLNHLSSGLVGFIHCRHNGHPGFESQSKNQVLAKKLRKLAKTLEFKIYNKLLKNKKATKLIIKKVKANHEALNKLNKVSKLLNKTNKKIRKRKTAKLTEATTKKKHSAELYIVEGDSAGGMMTKVRNSKKHSILRLKGKPKNAIKTKLKTLLKNEEIKNLIYAMGGIGKSFNFNKLKYKKIIITSDQDVDGSHISALLVAFFQKFYPKIIEEGFLYKCLTPLYVLTTKNGKEYFYSEKEKDKYIRKNKINLVKNKNTILRFKGLGEMNDGQYQKFILGKKQKLQRLINEEIEKNKKIVQDLLGEDASKKWKFLTSYVAQNWGDVIKKKEQELGQYTKDAIKEYGDYVLEERAIPNLADGLKNVHRRIIWAMKKAGITHNKTKRKVVSIIGETLNYHPHGDSSVEGAVKSITADWRNTIPLLEGQGNFGSELNHTASAARYVEARLSEFAEDVYLKNLTKKTVEWRENYDGRLQEPVQMPSVLPMSLLLNNSGISVGTTTKMPSFNLNEVVTALIKYVKLKNFKATKYIKGPDFPTGGNLIEPQKTINGNKKTFKLRAANLKFEKKGKKRYVVINELTYKQNYEKLILDIKEAISGFNSKGNKLPLKRSLKKEVKGMLDECGNNKIKIKLELKNNANVDVVKQKLYKITDLETHIRYTPKFLSFDENGNKQFQEYTLDQIISEFVKFRRKTLNKYFQEKVDEAKLKLNDLKGKLKILLNLDLLFKLIKQSDNQKIYITKIKKTFELNQKQAEYVARLRTQSLLKVDRKRLELKIKDIKKNIKEWEQIINNKEKKDEYMIKERKKLRKKYGYKRKTKIKDSDEIVDINLNKAKYKFKKESHKIFYSNNSLYKANIRKHNSTVKKLFEKNGEELKGVFESSTYDKLYFLVNLRNGGSKGLLLDNYDLVKDKMTPISSEFKEKIDSIEFGYTELKDKSVLNKKRQIIIIYENNRAFRIRKDRVVNSRRFNINKNHNIKYAWEIEESKIKQGHVKLRFREILKTKEREKEVKIKDLSELKNTGAGSYLVPKGRGLEDLELMIQN